MWWLTADGRLVWYGAALGALVGVLLVVMDEAVAKQPLLQVACHGCSSFVLYISQQRRIRCLHRHQTSRCKDRLVDFHKDVLCYIVMYYGCTVPCLHWSYLLVHCLDILRLWLLSLVNFFFNLHFNSTVKSAEFIKASSQATVELDNITIVVSQATMRSHHNGGRAGVVMCEAVSPLTDHQPRGGPCQMVERTVDHSGWLQSLTDDNIIGSDCCWVTLVRRDHGPFAMSLYDIVTFNAVISKSILKILSSTQYLYLQATRYCKTLYFCCILILLFSLHCISIWCFSRRWCPRQIKLWLYTVGEFQKFVCI